MGSGAIIFASEAGASSLPALHLGGMKGARLSRSPRFGVPGVGVPTRASYLGKLANLQEEREAGPADPCGDRGGCGGGDGVESSPPPCAPEGCREIWAARSRARDTSASGPPRPASEPGGVLHGILGQRMGGGGAARLSPRLPGGLRVSSAPRVGGGQTGRRRPRGWGSGTDVRGGPRLRFVRQFLANLGERAGAPRRAKRPCSVPLSPPTVGNRPVDGKAAQGKFMLREKDLQ